MSLDDSVEKLKLLSPEGDKFTNGLPGRFFPIMTGYTNGVPLLSKIVGKIYPSGEEIWQAATDYWKDRIDYKTAHLAGRLTPVALIAYRLYPIIN